MVSTHVPEATSPSDHHQIRSANNTGQLTRKSLAVRSEKVISLFPLFSGVWKRARLRQESARSRLCTTVATFQRMLCESGEESTRCFPYAAPFIHQLGLKGEELRGKWWLLSDFGAVIGFPHTAAPRS